MAQKEKKEKKEKQAAKVKGPRKSGKYKTIKTVVVAGQEVRKSPQKEKKVCGPACKQVCKYVKKGGCSLGLNFEEMGRCNYSKWSKHLPSTF